MKIKLFLTLAFVCTFFVSNAQKATNIRDLKNKKELYSAAVAKEIAKNIGINKEIEQKIEAIYIDYYRRIKLLEDHNPETLSTFQPILEKEQQNQVVELFNDKQKEKYKKYLESKKSEK